MPEINTEFLFRVALEIQVSNLGDTPYGRRRIFHFDAGTFEGPKLKGRVLPGGGGWSGWHSDPAPICALFPSSSQVPSRVRLFIDAMADWLNKRGGGFVESV